MAARQLATTASMSLTVPDCMCASPCRCRPAPRHDADQPALGVVLDAHHQRLGVLGTDVERGDRGERPGSPGARTRSGDATPELPARPSRCCAVRPPRSARAPRAPAARPRAAPRPGAPRPCRRPAPAPGARRRRRRCIGAACADRSAPRRSPRPPGRGWRPPAGTAGRPRPRATTATKRPVMPRRSSASAAQRGRHRRRGSDCTTTFVVARVLRAVRARRRRRAARCRRAAPWPPSPPRAGAPAAPRRAAAPSSSRSPSSWAVARSASSRVATSSRRRLAGHRLDASQPGADARLAGDHELPDLPGRRRRASRRTAPCCSRRPGRRAPTRARTSRRRTCRRPAPAPRSMRIVSGCTVGVAPDLLVDEALDLAQRLARRRRLRREVEAQRLRRRPTSRPAWPARPSTSRSARCSRWVPVWLRAAPQRRSASTSAPHARRPTASSPGQRAEVDDRLAGALGVLDRAGVPFAPISSPRSPTWPPPSA